MYSSICTNNKTLNFLFICSNVIPLHGDGHFLITLYLVNFSYAILDCHFMVADGNVCSSSVWVGQDIYYIRQG